MLHNFDLYKSVDYAFTNLLQNVSIQYKKEFVDVFNCIGRVLYDDIVSDLDIPQYPSSHMDGYAIRSEDTLNASSSCPITLKVSKNTSTIGKYSTKDLKFMEAFRIQTGGYLPNKSNAIVPIEEVKRINDSSINIFFPIKKGNFVYQTGSEIKRGQKVFSKGKILAAQDMASLANLRIDKVPVYKKPIVAIIPTGTELTDIVKENQNNDIQNVVNTNSPLISSIVDNVGGISENYGVTPDNEDILKVKLRIALDKSDIVITIGGSSVGNKDIVSKTINSIGMPGVISHGIKLDRGRVSGLAAVNKKPIIILPGPIQGALNAFIVFARPLIRIISGLPQKSNLSIFATLTDNWKARKKFQHFKKILYVSLFKDNNQFSATPFIGETHSISLLSKCNGYVEVSEDIVQIDKGEQIEVNLLPAFSYTNDCLINN
jgi:molybdenum cofactor synthesis domain-containing protein